MVCCAKKVVYFRQKPNYHTSLMNMQCCDVKGYKQPHSNPLRVFTGGSDVCWLEVSFGAFFLTASLSEDEKYPPACLLIAISVLAAESPLYC